MTVPKFNFHLTFCTDLLKSIFFMFYKLTGWNHGVGLLRRSGIIKKSVQGTRPFLALLCSLASITHVEPSHTFFLNCKQKIIFNLKPGYSESRTITGPLKYPNQQLSSFYCSVLFVGEFFVKYKVKPEKTVFKREKIFNDSKNFSSNKSICCLI